MLTVMNLTTLFQFKSSVITNCSWKKAKVWHFFPTSNQPEKSHLDAIHEEYVRATMF